MVIAITDLEVFISQSDDKLSNYHSTLNYFYDDFFLKQLLWLKASRFLLFLPMLQYFGKQISVSQNIKSLILKDIDVITRVPS